MAIWVAIILIVIALIAGLIGGFLLARKYMKDYLKKNPPINEEMLRMIANGTKTISKENQSNDDNDE